MNTSPLPTQIQDPFPWGAATGLFLVAVLLLLVLGEVALRVSELPERLARQRSIERGLYQLDDAAGYVMRPNFVGRLSTLEFDQPFRTNAQGLRGAELGPKQPGEFRIVVLGDSFTFAGQVVEQDRFTERVELLLRQRGHPNARVVNAGTGGWTTLNESGFLGKHRDWLAPDLVIVALFVGNDIGENVLATLGGYRESETNPNGIGWGSRAAELLQYSNDWFDHNRRVGAVPPGGEILGKAPQWHDGDPLPSPRLTGAGRASDAPNPAVDGDQPDAKTSRMEPISLGSGVDWFRENARLYRWTSEQWYSLRSGYGRPKALNLGTWLAYTLTDPPAHSDIQMAFPLAEKYLVDARDTAALEGARLVLMIIPDVAQVDERKQAQALETYRLKPEEADLNRPQRELTQRAQRHGIGVVDLTPLLRARPDRAALYYSRDEHFTREGHEVAAHALADGLERFSMALSSPSLPECFAGVRSVGQASPDCAVLK